MVRASCPCGTSITGAMHTHCFGRPGPLLCGGLSLYPPITSRLSTRHRQHDNNRLTPVRYTRAMYTCRRCSCTRASSHTPPDVETLSDRESFDTVGRATARAASLGERQRRSKPLPTGCRRRALPPCATRRSPGRVHGGCRTKEGADGGRGFARPRAVEVRSSHWALEEDLGTSRAKLSIVSRAAAAADLAQEHRGRVAPAPRAPFRSCLR